MDILVSIIIPIYNMEKYLPECLDSLQRQHFGDEVEILLLNDGSKDSSGKICESVAQADAHFRVFHQKNKGVAATRNRGLNEARGKYIAWVDPDDYVTDDWWQVLRPVLLKGPDLVYFDLKTLENGQMREVHFDSASRIIPRDEWYQELANGDRIMSHLWSKIFLRSLFEYPKTFNENLSYYEDYQALHRVTFPIRECVYLHNCLYVYRQVNTSIVHDKSQILTNAWLSIQISKERNGFYRDKGVQVSPFGILYLELKFCITCRVNENQTLSVLMKEHYQECLDELFKYKSYLLKNDHLSGKLKIHLILFIYHLYFIVPVLRKLKRVFSRRG